MCGDVSKWFISYDKNNKYYIIDVKKYKINFHSETVSDQNS